MLAGEAEALEGEGWAVEIATLHSEIRSEFSLQVGHHSVAGGGRGGQQAHIGQGLHQPAHAAVIRTEVVAPVGDAVGFIDHHQAGVELGERPTLKIRSVQPLWRDQQDVDLSLSDLLLHLQPLIGVRGIDRAGNKTHSLGGGHLVAHQR